MLALMCTMLFAAAATFAVGAIVVTMQGRRGQIVALIAEYRSLQHDREFLFRIIAHPAATPAEPVRQRSRWARRAMRRAEAAPVVRVLRAAA